MSFSGTNSDATVSSLAKSGDLHINMKEPPLLSQSRRNKNNKIDKTKQCIKMGRSYWNSPFIYDAEGFPVPGHYNRDGSVKHAAAHPATHARKVRVLTA